jgi:guanylate kinase
VEPLEKPQNETIHVDETEEVVHNNDISMCCHVLQSIATREA